MPVVLAETSTSLTTIMSEVGEVFTGLIGNVGAVATTIVENPVLLLFVSVGLTGTIIGIFKRLLHD